jgi:hypothetical protein
MLLMVSSIQGAFTHQDFAGHKGTIGTGDVQVLLYPPTRDISFITFRN